MRQGKSCGYDSCPCKGVHFISSYQGEVDYCVNGQRVMIREDRSPAREYSAADMMALRLWLISEYARYLIWHCTQKQKHPGEYMPEIEPFRELSVAR